MKHLRHTVLLALATFAITIAARPCGPDFPEAVFVLQTGPGGNYASYAAGHIGVPQQGYRIRHMVIAYDYLSGHPLPEDVQKQAVAVNAYLLNPWESDDQAGGSPGKLSGFKAWIAARSAFGAVDGYMPDAGLATNRSIPGENYGEFTNCLDDAFSTAAKTLANRIAAHSADDPAVIDWVRAQDAVFSNCGDGKVPSYFGAGKPPVPPPQPHPPAAAPANAPEWLKQDRAYQSAAASFYALEFDDAISRFRSIAGDSASPWSLTARYLVARTYLRKASIEDPDLSYSHGNDHASQQDAAAKYRATMALARHELVEMQSEASMASMRSSIDGLLDYVNIRLEPEAQAAVLATRLQSPSPASFHQALLDLTWLHSSHIYGSAPIPALHTASHSNDMNEWIDAVYTNDESSALKHWHSTRSTAWLLAAISNSKPADSSAPELLRAAGSVPQTDPGWLAITYHRLRLSPRNATTRAEVLALLPQIRASEDVSATNLFLALSTATAPSLQDWLATVPRTPAGASSGDGEEVLPNSMVSSTQDSERGTQPAFIEDACGKQFPANTVLPLFDSDAASILNRDMPLRLLAQSAESTALPNNLRFQVAQATWARAVLLDKPELAHRMTPILTGCRAAWNTVLAAYDAASTPDQRHAAGLLALMRFASTVPSVWDGEDRRQNFATYDAFRQNWWCSAVPRPRETIDSDPDLPATVDEGSAPAIVPPPFLTSTDLAEAHNEVASLEQIPRASTYFAQQALAWQKLHPADPQTPDILGEADRVLRNSCRKDPAMDEHGNTHENPGDMALTTNLAKALFETLQRNYPASTWAKRYKTWQ